MSIEEIYSNFLKLQRDRTYYKGGYLSELFYQSHQDLFWDIEFYITHKIEKKYGVEFDDNPYIEKFLHTNKVEIDPKEELDEIIVKVLEATPWYEEKQQIISDSSLQDLNLTREELWKRSWNYTACHLENYLFSWKLFGQKNRFSKESLDKLIEVGTKVLVYDINTLLTDSRDKGFTYNTNQNLNISLSNYECVDFTFLFQKLHEEIIRNFYEQEEVFNLNESPKENASNYINEENYLVKVKVEDLPIDEFSEEMLLDVQHLIDILLLAHKELKNKSFARKTIFWIFLLYAYFGCIDGIIPGIKQGGYTSLRLAQDLSEFINFKDDFISKS